MTKKGKTLHFKNKRNYIKWVRYGHATGVFKKTPGNQEIVIVGRKHKPKHKK